MRAGNQSQLVKYPPYTWWTLWAQDMPSDCFSAETQQIKHLAIITLRFVSLNNRSISVSMCHQKRVIYFNNLHRSKTITLCTWWEGSSLCGSLFLPLSERSWGCELSPAPIFRPFLPHKATLGAIGGVAFVRIYNKENGNTTITCCS